MPRAHLRALTLCLALVLASRSGADLLSASPDTVIGPQGVPAVNGGR